MKSNGLATILLMIPVLTVPAFAIFGIPQFAPVVASPLEEGASNDREKRVGNSAKLPHDELFEDLDSNASAAEPRKGASSNLGSRSALNGPKHRGGVQREDPLAAADWEQDLEPVAGDPKRTRVNSSRNLAEETTIERPLADANSNVGSNPERLARYKRLPRQPGKKLEISQPITPDSSDNRIDQIAYVDDVPEQKSNLNPPSGNRPKASAARNSKRREQAPDDLTWSGAVERLNELDIRSFRLEPGAQRGQFVFICTYTPPDTPVVSYRFEAEADQPLKAVQKVLDQIVEWRQRR